MARHLLALVVRRHRQGPRAPARRDAYEDPELLAANPFLAELARQHEHAVARPAVPRYALASDILQRHLSAALAGTVDARGALRAAARETRAMLKDSRAREPAR